MHLLFLISVRCWLHQQTFHYLWDMSNLLILRSSVHHLKQQREEIRGFDYLYLSFSSFPQLSSLLSCSFLATISDQCRLDQSVAPRVVNQGAGNFSSFLVCFKSCMSDRKSPSVAMKSWWNPLSSWQRSYCLAGKQQNSWGYFFSALSLARADQIASAFQESSCFVMETHLGLWRSCGIWLCRHGDMPLHPPSLFLQVMYLIQRLWLKTNQPNKKQVNPSGPSSVTMSPAYTLAEQPVYRACSSTGEQHLHHDSFSLLSRACEQQASSLLLYGRGGGSFACTYSNSRLKVQSSDTRLDVNCRGHCIMYRAWMSLRCCEIFLTYLW